MSARRRTRSTNRGGAALGARPVVQAGPPPKVPMPAILDGRSYLVRDSGPAATGRAFVQRVPGADHGVMHVPFEDTPGGRRVRLHEMAHVRWTPANGHAQVPEGVSWETVNAVEDCRMHKRLREVGFGDALDSRLLGPEDWETWQESVRVALDPDDPRNPWPLIEVARATVATHGTREQETWRRIARHAGWEWVLAATDEIRERHLGANKRRPAFKRTVECATELDQRFAELDELPPDVQGRMRDYDPSPDPARWGEMTIERPPLVERMAARLRVKVRRSTDTGTVPRNWHRLPVDGRVFTQRRQRPGGGAVLLDQSGSMHLDLEQVQALMAAFPAVTIATYAGSSDHGTLKIIAEGGMRASERDCYHTDGGNTVDGPALEWLCEQDGPRIWVSDGMVTGAGQSQSQSLLLDAAAICKRGNIERVEDLAELLPGWGEA